MKQVVQKTCYKIERVNDTLDGQLGELYTGRVIAQAISRRLPTAAARIQTRV
jgi:hypothetical protein